MNNNNTLTEKYRPINIEDVVSHDLIKNTIYNYLDNKYLPNMLFYGKPGLGKTSLIISLVNKYYNIHNHNLIIINASEERGVQTIRDKIEPYCNLSLNKSNNDFLNFKLIVLDEVDSMTIDAQNILRIIVEKHINNVRFCLICNYLNKIILPLQSRFIIFKFKPLTTNYLNLYLNKILNLENIIINKKALNIIYKYCDGDLRKILNIIQSLKIYNNSNDIIKENDVKKLIKYPSSTDIIKFIKFFKKYNLQTSIETITSYFIENNLLLNEVIMEFYDTIINFIINKNYTYYDIEKMKFIVNKMAIINKNLVNSHQDNINIISFISIFY